MLTMTNFCHNCEQVCLVSWTHQRPALTKTRCRRDGNKRNIMMTTLEKVKRLEQYLVVDSSMVDPVLDMSINKLLVREQARIQALKTRLLNQLMAFEQAYSLTATEFYTRYEKGEMGDEMDWVEWAATVEMLTHVENRLKLLQIDVNL